MQSAFSRPIQEVVLWVVAAAALLLAWLAPNHTLPWPTFHAEIMASVALAALTLSRLTAPGVYALRLPTLAQGAALLAVVPVGQWLGGLIPYAGEATLTASYLLAFSVSVVVGAEFARAFGVDRVLRLIACVIFAGAVISVGLQLYQWFELGYLWSYVQNYEPTARLPANLIQPNNLATLLVLGLLAVCYLFEKREIGVTVGAASASMLMVGIAITQSRAAVLLVLLAGAALLFLRRRLELRVRRRHIFFCFAALILLMAAWPAVNLATHNTTDRPFSEQIRVGTRPLHWAAMLDAVSRRPLVGFGWQQIIAAQYEVAPDHLPPSERIHRAHNLLLDLLLTNGVVIGGAVIVGLAVWFWRRATNLTSAGATIALLMVSVVFGHAMLEFALDYAYFLFPVGVLMGILDGDRLKLPHGLSANLQAPRWLLLIATVGLLGILSLVVNDYLVAEQSLADLRFEQARIGNKDRERSGAPELIVLSQLREFLAYARFEGRRAMEPSTLEWMSVNAKHSPGAIVVLRYARALALNGRDADAADALRRICPITPADDCVSAQRWWKAMGRSDPEVARVQFPTLPPSLSSFAISEEQ